MSGCPWDMTRSWLDDWCVDWLVCEEPKVSVALRSDSVMVCELELRVLVLCVECELRVLCVVWELSVLCVVW